MTQAFNLSQFANNVNSSGKADLTNAATGTLSVANGGTGSTTLDGAGIVTKTNTQTITGVKTFGANIAVSSDNSYKLGSNTARWNGVWSANFIVDQNATPNATIYLSGTTDLGLAGGGVASVALTSTAVRAIIDNSTTMGASGARWSAVWAANGTIQTSDQRQKTDVQDSSLGLEFINTLRPVSFKWILGGNDVTATGDIQNPIVTPRPGKRTHYGLLAQEVEQALAGQDFGGLVYDGHTDTYALRYDQFISPLIKAVQELSKKVTALENEIVALKNN